MAVVVGRFGRGISRFEDRTDEDKERSTVTKIRVLSPMGFPPEVVGKAMAPRLDNLDGKTIGLLDCRFDQSGVVLEEIERWIRAHLPSVTLKTIQMARALQPDPEAIAEIASFADGVIAAVGHCSTCSPGVASQVLALETEYGIPAVGVHSVYFKRLVDSHLRVHGMPTLRMAYMPHPIVTKSPEEIRAYVEGTDQVTGRPFMDELLGALTRPLEQADIEGVSFERPEAEFVEASGEAELQDLFIERGWTDYLPIVPPTPELVEAMLRGTSRDPHDIVQYLRPTGFRESWAMTVERVAVNAVMAGAKPEYLPAILALIATGKTPLSSTTTSMGGFGFINGPFRHEIKMNAGIGAMGPWNHANMTIGRAFSLASRNGQGGSVPGLTYMGSVGNVYNYVPPIFPENEEDSPYEPFHVQHGFDREASTATVLGGCWYTTNIRGLRPDRWREVVGHILRGGNPLMGPTLVMDPVLARAFVTRGLDTKEKLIEFMHSAAQMPAADFWDQDDSQTFFTARAKLGEEPYLSNSRAKPEQLVPMYAPDQIAVVVTGGGTMGTGRIIGTDYHTFTGGATAAWGSRQTTVSIDDWR